MVKESSENRESGSSPDPSSAFDFDKAVESIRNAASELAKPEVRRALGVIGAGASALTAIQDAVKAVAIQDAVKAVAVQDAVKSVTIQDAVKAVAIQDAVKAVAVQDAVKAVLGRAEHDLFTPAGVERLSQVLNTVREAAEVASKKRE